MLIHPLQIGHPHFDISGHPLGARPFAPEQLHPYLPRDTADPGLYLLADPTRIQAINKVMDLDLYDDSLQAAPLWGEDMPQAEGAGALGPWLLHLSVPDEAREGFLRKYFTTYAGHRCGVFLITRADPADLRQFLRGLCHVERLRPGHEDPQRLLLRFWDPLVAHHLLGSAAGHGAAGDAPAGRDMSGRAARLMRTAGGHPVRWLVEDGLTSHWLYAPDDGLAQAVRMPIRLESGDDPLFARITWRALEDELHDWLIDAYPRFAALPATGRTSFVKRIIGLGQQANFTLKEEFAYLAHLWLHLGTAAMDPVLNPEITQALRAGTPQRHKPLRPAFAAAWARQPLAVLGAEAMAALRRDLSALAAADLLQPDTMHALMSRHLPAGARSRLSPYLQAIARHRPALPDPSAQAGHDLLALMLGPEFDTDLRYPWAEAPETVQDKMQAALAWLKEDAHD